MSRSRPYGCLAFLFDVFMCLLTAAIFHGVPLWLVWIFIRGRMSR